MQHGQTPETEKGVIHKSHFATRIRINNISLRIFLTLLSQRLVGILLKQGSSYEKLELVKDMLEADRQRIESGLGCLPVDWSRYRNLSVPLILLLQNCDNNTCPVELFNGHRNVWLLRNVGK